MWKDITQPCMKLKLQAYLGESRNALIRDFRTKLKQQTGIFYWISQVQSSSLHASYTVSFEFAKAKKPFTNGAIV